MRCRRAQRAQTVETPAAETPAVETPAPASQSRGATAAAPAKSARPRTKLAPAIDPAQAPRAVSDRVRKRGDPQEDGALSGDDMPPRLMGLLLEGDPQEGAATSTREPRQWGMAGSVK